RIVGLSLEHVGQLKLGFTGPTELVQAGRQEKLALDVRGLAEPQALPGFGERLSRAPQSQEGLGEKTPGDSQVRRDPDNLTELRLGLRRLIRLEIELTEEQAGALTIRIELEGGQQGRLGVLPLPAHELGDAEHLVTVGRVRLLLEKLAGQSS